MPVSYADIEKKRLGELAMANQKAQELIANEAEQARIQNNIAEQQVSDEDSKTQEAMDAIDKMHQVEANGGNPLEVVQSLPEDLQIRVASIMKSEIEKSKGNNPDVNSDSIGIEPSNEPVGEQNSDTIPSIAQVNKA
jgi:hypothetical protein